MTTTRTEESSSLTVKARAYLRAGRSMRRARFVLVAMALVALIAFLGTAPSISQLHTHCVRFAQYCARHSDHGCCGDLSHERNGGGGPSECPTCTLFIVTVVVSVTLLWGLAASGMLPCAVGVHRPRAVFAPTVDFLKVAFSPRAPPLLVH